MERLTKLYARLRAVRPLARPRRAGDFGTSLRRAKLITEKMGATIELAVASLLAVLIGVPLGVISWRNTWVDFSSMFVALVGVSAPNFWIGLIY